MMDRVQQLVVEAGLPWAQGNAVISIFDGDIENAVAFLELTERGEVAKDEQGEAPAKKAKQKKRNGANDKSCIVCGEKKGITGFRRGSDTCVKCQKAGA